MSVIKSPSVDYLSTDVQFPTESGELFLERMQVFDKNHIWHPYSAIGRNQLPMVVDSYQAQLLLDTPEHYGLGRIWVVDAMSSWWSAIHGYKNPVIDQAAITQLGQFSHVMFGGLTHLPAINLTQKLLALAPRDLDTVFYSDSGSVAVEVAIKMALHYQQIKGKKDKIRLATFRGDYHGDTFETMSISDPYPDVSHQWTSIVVPQIFMPRPGETYDPTLLNEYEQILVRHHHTIAAFIFEPRVQGAGNMRFYHPEYIRRIVQLCKKYDVICIADEVATGFGRTGDLFAVNSAGVSPDIMCVGKALSAGYIGFAATLCSAEIAHAIAEQLPYALSHGPTFMANPLACAIATASLELLESMNWKAKVDHIEQSLTQLLQPAKALPHVKAVRVLGAIGVIECDHPIPMMQATLTALSHGVWLRSLGNIIYTMPPYIVSDQELSSIADAMIAAVQAVYT